MPTYRTQIPTSWDPQTTFAYMATFANAAAWDPGVAAAERLGDGPIRVGTGFRLWVLIAGRRHLFEYRVVRLEPDHSITLAAQTRWLRSSDTIEVDADGNGAVVRYVAHLEARGMRAADRVLARALRRIGDRAAAGLRATLPVPVADDPGRP